MVLPQPKYRKILLSEDITKDSVRDIIKEIMEINEDDDYKEILYKDWTRDPIQLFINSFGGSAYDGLALIDIIKTSRTPVHTISIGSCMSMGFWIYLAGHKRYVGKHTTLMFHDITGWVHDKTSAVKQELDELLRLQKLCCDEITSTSTITQEELNRYIERKAEWYISAQEAIKLKLANGYYQGD